MISALGDVNTIGLVFASAASVANVVTDVARKKALRDRPLLPTIFLAQAITAVALSALLLSRLLLGHWPTIHFAVHEASFIEGSHLSPGLWFLFYLLLDTSLVGIAVVLYYRALQVSPISLCVPFLAFTPVFLLATGSLFLAETVRAEQVGGVAFVVLGSLLMNRRLFQDGWLEPFRALAREKGSRYMLIVGFIFSITNPIDKRLVEMSDPFFHAWAYGGMLVVLLGAALLVKRRSFHGISSTSWKWIALAALLEAAALLLQFASHNYIQVVITISLKRAGAILAVVFGGLVFHERAIGDRLLAAAVMVAGAFMLYVPMSNRMALTFSAVVLLGLIVTLFLSAGRRVSNVPSIEKSGAL